MLNLMLNMYLKKKTNNSLTNITQCIIMIPTRLSVSFFLRRYILDNNSKQANMILNDNLWKVMIKMSLPAVIAMVLHGLNLIFDGIFVGKFVGDVALSGISLAYPLTQISIGFGSMLGGGAGAYLSILIGEKDRDTQEKILGNTNFLGLVFTAFIMLILFITARPLLIFMGGEGEALEIGLTYFRITVIGTLVWVFALGYNMIIRAEGKMGTAAFIMGIGLVTNIITNYILIVLLDFGVAGAAWGTNLGMLVYTLASVIYFKSNKTSFKAKVFSARRDKHIVKKIIELGMPSLIMSIMSIIQISVILNAIGAIGTDYDIAFYGVTFRFYMFIMTPLFALMRSLQPAVGVNFGAKKYDRVERGSKVYILGSLILMVPITIFVLIKPELALGLMLDGDISADNIFNFRIFIAVIPLLAVSMNGMSYFPSIGEGKPAAQISLLRQVILYIPAMIILPRLFGLSYVYIGSFAIDAVLSIIVLLMLSGSFKKLRKKQAELL